MYKYTYYIIYHISYIIYHISYIIYHVSYIIYHISYIIYHISYIIYHISYIIYHISYIIYHISYIIYHISYIIYHISYIIYHIYIYHIFHQPLNDVPFNPPLHFTSPSGQGCIPTDAQVFARPGAVAVHVEPQQTLGKGDGAVFGPEKCWIFRVVPWVSRKKMGIWLDLTGEDNVIWPPSSWGVKQKKWRFKKMGFEQPKAMAAPWVANMFHGCDRPTTSGSRNRTSFGLTWLVTRCPAPKHHASEIPSGSDGCAYDLRFWSES